MKINRDEILDALRTLKELCTVQANEGGCSRCPLSRNEFCNIDETPRFWELNESEKDWKAFK